MNEGKICEICGSNKWVYKYRNKQFLCSKHVNQIKRNGEIKERTTADPNDFIVKGKYTEIILRDIKQNVTGKVLISTSKIDLAKKLKWYLNSNGYAMSYKNGKHLLLHRYIVSANDNEIIDHINRTKLDCRDENLRPCTSSQNAMNSKTRTNNTSGRCGVWYNKLRNKWVAEIKVNGKKISLGYYKEIDDAIKARNDAEEKYFKEFRVKR